MDWSKKIKDAQQIVCGQDHAERKLELTTPSSHLDLPESETVTIEQKMSAEDALNFYSAALDVEISTPDDQQKLDALKPAVQMKMEWARQAIADNNAEQAFKAGLDLANSFHSFLLAMGLGEQIAQGRTNQVARQAGTTETNRASAELNRKRDQWICDRWTQICQQENCPRPMSIERFHRSLVREFPKQNFREEVKLPSTAKGVEKILKKYDKLEPALRSSKTV